MCSVVRGDAHNDAQGIKGVGQQPGERPVHAPAGPLIDETADSRSPAVYKGQDAQKGDEHGGNPHHQLHSGICSVHYGFHDVAFALIVRMHADPQRGGDAGFGHHDLGHHQSRGGG